jgi:hypothetical protein
MRSLFAIGVGGSGAKCIEALTHLHAAGLLKDDNGQPWELHTFLVEPDKQSTLLVRAERAVHLYSEMQALVSKRTRTFATARIRHYGTWNPIDSKSKSLAAMFPQEPIKKQAPELAALFNCLFHPDEQTVDLGYGFRGRPPIGSMVMARIDLASLESEDKWQKLLSSIKEAAGNSQEPVVHLFGSVFGGTGASGVPTLGELIKNWLRDQQQNLNNIPVHASLLLPYFDFENPGQSEVGLHAEARSFLLNTDAALQYLGENGKNHFNRTYLIGSESKTRYDFAIGGIEQKNDAHLVELLAALAVRDGLRSLSSQSSGCDAYVLSRSKLNTVIWEDLPEWRVVGPELARAARFGVAWLNNITKDLEKAQDLPLNKFIKGAAWSTHFFSLKEDEKWVEGRRPGIRDNEQLAIKKAIDDYTEIWLQWLHQFTSNPGSGISQQLFTSEELVRRDGYQNELDTVVIGSARPQSAGEKVNDTVEEIKFKIDKSAKDDIRHYGVPGLADTLWTLSA